MTSVDKRSFLTRYMPLATTAFLLSAMFETERGRPWTSQGARTLVRFARQELGYSPRTVDCDIYRGLRKEFNGMAKAE